MDKITSAAEVIAGAIGATAVYMPALFAAWGAGLTLGMVLHGEDGGWLILCILAGPFVMLLSPIVHAWLVVFLITVPLCAMRGLYAEERWLRLSMLAVILAQGAVEGYLLL